MLKDRFFYPLALAVMAGMVYFALSLGSTPKQSIDELRVDGFVTTGEDLITLTASPGTNYEFIAKTNNSPAHVIMWTDVPRENAVPSAGIFAAIAPQYETAFAGQTLRMTIRARKGRRNPLSSFDTGYFTAGEGQSDWQQFRLTSTFEDYSFEFTPRLRPENSEPDLDYFGVWPGRDGERRTMDVSRYEIEVLSNPGQLRK